MLAKSRIKNNWQQDQKEKDKQHKLPSDQLCKSTSSVYSDRNKVYWKVKIEFNLIEKKRDEKS